MVVRRRQPLVDDAVRVRIRRRLRSPRPSAQSTRTARPDCGAEVDADRVARRPHASPRCGSTITFRPRLSLRLANASDPVGSAAYRSLTSELSSMRPFSARVDRTREVGRLHPAAERDRESFAARDRRREARAVVVGDAHEDETAAGPQRVDRSRDRVVSPATSNATSTPPEAARGRISVPARRVCTATVAPSASAAAMRCGSGSVAHEHVHAGMPKQLDEQETERAAAVHARRHARSRHDRGRARAARLRAARAASPLRRGASRAADG